MITFDDGRWPLVTVSKQGRFTVADATNHVIAFDNLLRRREPFAVAVVYNDEAAAHERDPAAAAIYGRWWDANREVLAAWCRGLAAVAPAVRVRRVLAERLSAAVDGSERATALFVLPEAERWLADRLADHDSAAAAGGER